MGGVNPLTDLDARTSFTLSNPLNRRWLPKVEAYFGSEIDPADTAGSAIIGLINHHKLLAPMKETALLKRAGDRRNTPPNYHRGEQPDKGWKTIRLG